MNNGKAFSSLDGMASSYQCYQTSFSFYQELTSQGIGFLETLKNPANLFKYNLNKTRNNMKSQIQKKKTKKKNGGIVELLIHSTNIFPKKTSHEGTKTFLGKKIIGRLF